MFHQIFFAVNPSTGEVRIFGTKYLAPGNVRGSRFSFVRINLGLERLERSKVIDWVHGCNGQGEQLQIHLGPEWRVLSQYAVCCHISNGEYREKRTMVKIV